MKDECYSLRVIHINENPKTLHGAWYAYVNINDIILEEAEPRVFLDSNKEFIGIGLPSAFADAEWSRPVYGVKK